MLHAMSLHVALKCYATLLVAASCPSAPCRDLTYAQLGTVCRKVDTDIVKYVFVMDCDQVLACLVCSLACQL